MTDEEKPTTYETLEEAIAAAAADVGADGVVEIHDVTCQRRDDRADDPDACTCTPMYLIVGENN